MKKVVYCFFLSKYLKNGWNYFDKKKKNWRNHGILVYQKALISEHRKNYIFRDNKCLFKMSVSLYVTNFCGRASSKTSVNIKATVRR